MNIDFIVGFTSGACAGAAIVLWLWAFYRKKDKQESKAECIGYNERGEDT